MTNPIPDEAVEAAARAFDAAEYDDPDSVTEAEWAMVSDAEREFYLSAARRALTAAAPIIAAQATADLDLAKVWREGYYAGRDHAESIAADGTSITPSNPYLGSRRHG